MIKPLVKQQGLDNPQTEYGDPRENRPSTCGPGHRAYTLPVLRLLHQPGDWFFYLAADQQQRPPGWVAVSAGGVHTTRAWLPYPGKARQTVRFGPPMHAKSPGSKPGAISGELTKAAKAEGRPAPKGGEKMLVECGPIWAALTGGRVMGRTIARRPPDLLTVPAPAARAHGGVQNQGPHHTSEAPTSSPGIPRRERDKLPSLSDSKKLLSFPKEPRQERGGSGPRPDHQCQEEQGPVGWPAAAGRGPQGRRNQAEIKEIEHLFHSLNR